jgi:exodeoxyribonuclease VII large subunit
VLARGYSITQHTADGRIVRDAGELQPGERITTRFARGEAVSRVE